MKKLSLEISEWVKTIGGVVLAYLTLTTVAFANYSIPSESMVPHLEVGDRVIVSKYAYGYSRHSLPLGLGLLLPASERRLFERTPMRGDVVVFIHPVDGKIMIKRCVGLPGDTIEVRDGVLFVNDRRAAQGEPTRLLRSIRPERTREWAERREEMLPGGRTHALHNLTDDGRYDNFGPYVVPAGRLFFMGDNRDNSLDSRWVGMGTAPMENLIGRAELVYYAADDCGDDAATTCPMPRWLRPLHH